MSEFVLYSYFRSSASHRVRIALHLKRVPFEYRPVHLLNNGGEQNSDDYGHLNPSHQVPTLVHNGRALGQSMAIIDYLDACFPQPRLFAGDPFRRAQILQACEIMNSGIQPLHNLAVLNELEKRWGATNDDKAAWTLHWIERGLQSLDQHLAQHSGKFCFGDEVTAADVYLVPQYFSGKRFNFDLSRFPRLDKIIKNCLALEGFQKASPDAQPDAHAPAPAR